MERIKTIESFSQDFERDMALAADLRDPFLASSHDDGPRQPMDLHLSRCVLLCLLWCVVLDDNVRHVYCTCAVQCSAVLYCDVLCWITKQCCVVL